ncbi:hypothetical protein GCM10008023_41110 [Sphingomonas glacialis]|uniref:Uncharacterized protein n=1 Tax=Sphingomonas glacialis TaxID=658225 RepID=A0ABQ3LUY3_9SPHN|nr:hypothetical protein [Sphingomonas glacialis]GHH26475.1 hypothetical protein GCM10008023_41110 [Sphingomonas glacialis]
MNTDQVNVALAGVLDALTLVQEQLDALTASSERIEATHKEIVNRLDTIEAGQAAVTDLTPIFEMILGRSIDDREIMKTQLGTIATAIGFAHAAANGNRAPLPVAVASDPLLERFILTQPADLLSDERSLTDWRNAASAASTAELIVLLNRQYQPSPTDTPETRVLRYRLAALTRAEIKGRGAAPPAPPNTTVAVDRTASACMIRSHQLSGLWRAGESAALYSEPELAGAIDLFDDAERRLGSAAGVDFPPELVSLHSDLATRIEAGDRPSISDSGAAYSNERATAVEPSKDR